MMEILYNTKALGLGISTHLSPSGGVAPYTWSVEVMPDTPQGTISIDGVYTASYITGTDKIILTDSLLATAELSISVLHPMELLCDIIKTCMQLEDDQVYIYNQKLEPVKDSRLYVAVGVITDKYFGNSAKYEASGLVMNEIQSANCMTNLSIDIISRNEQAKDRRWEIVLALNSKYSQNQQELNSFNVGKIPGMFSNLSTEAGAAIPFRFNISVNMQYFVQTIKPVAFYDTFNDIELEVNK